MNRILLAALAASVVSFAPAQAQNSGVELGQLSCQVEGGVGFIFGSSKDIVCTFSSAGGTEETYTGEINKYGVDIGVTGKQVILWQVVAAENDLYKPGALSGTYSGASAEASFAVGLGANVLVGGGNESFALQPLSVSASEGVNVAVGFAQLTLTQ